MSATECCIDFFDNADKYGTERAIGDCALGEINVMWTKGGCVADLLSKTEAVAAQPSHRDMKDPQLLSALAELEIIMCGDVPEHPTTFLLCVGNCAVGTSPVVLSGCLPAFYASISRSLTPLNVVILHCDIHVGKYNEKNLPAATPHHLREILIFLKNNDMEPWAVWGYGTDPIKMCKLLTQEFSFRFLTTPHPDNICVYGKEIGLNMCGAMSARIFQLLRWIGAPIDPLDLPMATLVCSTGVTADVLLERLPRDPIAAMRTLTALAYVLSKSAGMTLQTTEEVRLARSLAGRESVKRQKEAIEAGAPPVGVVGDPAGCATTRNNKAEEAAKRGVPRDQRSATLSEMGNKSQELRDEIRESLSLDDMAALQAAPLEETLRVGLNTFDHRGTAKLSANKLMPSGLRACEEGGSDKLGKDSAGSGPRLPPGGTSKHPWCVKCGVRRGNCRGSLCAKCAKD
eukprot:gnl/Spiro4/10577_TR5662_c0_g1_i1.p1 gnl/Spiro4/10577_TR5662_c0_g1~~gnl/Spiro4/10577_TR5662_c0_g1_i1.p1  ORF type:complete len:458 (-),score=47.35 gnl/Spiro4/10577_TR5662_c0_g1_i1:62-1435(-)